MHQIMRRLSLNRFKLDDKIKIQMQMMNIKIDFENVWYHIYHSKFKRDLKGV